VKTIRKILQILLPLVSLLSVLASCGSKPPAQTTGTTAATTVADTQPATNYIYVNGADEMTLGEAARVLTADDAELSAQMGYVTHIGNDIMSGTEKWEAFLKLVEEGRPAVVRITKFYRFDGEGEDTDKSVTIADLTYDGNLFFYDRLLKSGEVRSRVYAYLCYDKVTADHSQQYHPEYTEMTVYILSNHENATYDDYMDYNTLSGGVGFIVEVAYQDCIYPEEEK